MHSTLIRRMAARWVLDLVQPIEVIDFAHSLLDAGTYSYSLGELATLPPGWEPDRFERFLHGTLSEFGGKVPCNQSAVETLVAERLEACFEGREPPSNARSLCADLQHRFGWRAAQDLLQAVHCEELWSLYWNLDEYEQLVTDGINPPEAYASREQESNRMVMNLAHSWIREHFGCCFRKEDRTADVIALAQAIHVEGAFDRLPILADALEDAGCTNADVLEHLRQPAAHIRGCWVVDLLLEKAGEEEMRP